MHDAFHIAFLIVFFGAMGMAFLGLIKPLLDGGAGLRLPGPRTTAGILLAAVLAAAGDWAWHQYIR